MSINCLKIINEILYLFPNKYVKKIEHKTGNLRRTFEISKLLKYKTYKECKPMPENVINGTLNVSAFGLDNNMKIQNRRCFIMNKLTENRNCESYKSMPENIINKSTYIKGMSC